jgi:hypothetical protein
MKLAGHKRMIMFCTFLVLNFLGYEVCQAMTHELIESRKKTVVFIGKLQVKTSTDIDKDGKCTVVYKTEPQFIATGFLVLISGSLDFSLDDFDSKLTAQNLRKVITADIGDVLPSSPPEAIDWLNRLVRIPELYEKIIAKRDIKKLNSEANKQIEAFKRFYDESKTEKDLIKENRILLENFYPNETPKSQSIYHIATAKHVIFNSEKNEISDQDLFVFYNLKNGSLKSVPISIIKKEHNVDWVFHKNAQVDIALIPFPLDTATDDIMTIPDSIFLSADKVLETYDVFFLSFQPNTENVERISPIIRKGMISRLNNDGTFYIDGFAFPGNSGSPVFIKPEVGRLGGGDKGFSLGDPIAGKFIGIIGAYIPYREFAISMQTKQPRIMFEENTGLSIVWPVVLINEIIDSIPFKDQLSKILKKMKQPDTK